MGVVSHRMVIIGCLSVKLTVQLLPGGDPFFLKALGDDRESKEWIGGQSLMVIRPIDALGLIRVQVSFIKHKTHGAQS